MIVGGDTKTYSTLFPHKRLAPAGLFFYPESDWGTRRSKSSKTSIPMRSVVGIMLSTTILLLLLVAGLVVMLIGWICRPLLEGKKEKHCDYMQLRSANPFECHISDQYVPRSGSAPTSREPEDDSSSGSRVVVGEYGRPIKARSQALYSCPC